MSKLKSAAHGLDHTRGGLQLHGITLKDILEEVDEVSQDIDEINAEDALVVWKKVQRQLRNIKTLVTHACNEYDKDYKDLDELSKVIFDEIVRKPNTKKA